MKFCYLDRKKYKSKIKKNWKSCLFGIFIVSVIKFSLSWNNEICNVVYILVVMVYVSVFYY